jgi:mitochondrial import receptor subunit TOM22
VSNAALCSREHKAAWLTRPKGTEFGAVFTRLGKLGRGKKKSGATIKTTTSKSTSYPTHNKMVKLQEVEDEHFVQDQPGPPRAEENDDDYYTDTGESLGSLPLFTPIVNHAELDSDSEITDEEDGGDLEETFVDRITALRDVIPPKQRAALSSTFHTTYSWLRGGLLFGGKSLWVISTSALLLGVPWALAFAEEQQMIEMEKEMKMQQSANDVWGNSPAIWALVCANMGSSIAALFWCNFGYLSATRWATARNSTGLVKERSVSNHPCLERSDLLHSQGFRCSHVTSADVGSSEVLGVPIPILRFFLSFSICILQSSPQSIHVIVSIE